MSEDLIFAVQPCGYNLAKNGRGYDKKSSKQTLCSIRLVLDVLKSSSMSLFDGASIAIIKEHGGDFGLQKVFGAIGSIIFSPIAGKLNQI